MSITEIYSKRQKRLAGGYPDVYHYNEIPGTLRVQICHIATETIGPGYLNTRPREIYNSIIKILRKEYGVFQLPNTKRSNRDDPRGELFDFFLEDISADECLDVIELLSLAIFRITSEHYYEQRSNAFEIAARAIDELNSRFKEHGVGYQFVDGKIIRLDSEFIHAEVIKPALSLLGNKLYKGAQDEFLLAHEHYRHGNAKEALNECLKAFESTLKIICDKRDWDYPAGSTAKNLIKICFDNNLIPAFWQDHYNCLQKMLENGVPTGRNKLSGHGQGSDIINIPNTIVAYMLHMTASAIVFLAESEAALP